MRPLFAVVGMTILGLGFSNSANGALSITGVVNSASNVPPGLPNFGIAQGSIFVVYGSGLGPSTLQQAAAFPLPSTQGLAGTKVTVTVGGTTSNCIMLYTVASQVAALLPSVTPTGSGTLTVSYQGESGSAPIEVVKTGFGTFTLNEGGTGPAVLTDTDYNAITLINPAHPGDTLTLWGTGLGPVSGDETMPPVPADLGTGVQVFIGGQPAIVLYGGRSSDPGLDQINFVVPTGVAGGCRTSVAVLEQGVAANVTTMAIAPAGQTTCGDKFGLLTSANLQKAVSSGILSVGDIALYRFGDESDMVSARFGSYPLGSLIRSFGGNLSGSIGSCTAYESQGSAVIPDPIQPTPLDAGPSLALGGPAGSKTVFATSTGVYSATLGAAESLILPGDFTVSNGSGGANVSGFNESLALPVPLSLIGLPPVITRSQDLTVSWTDSSAFSLVSIFGLSSVPVSSTQTNYVQFYCTAPASASEFTIPSVILSLIPSNGFGVTGEPGVLLDVAGVAIATFSGSGIPGINAPVFDAFTYSGKVIPVQ